MWNAENIPDEAVLYERVHQNNLDEQNRPKPGAFRNLPTKEDGMSTDWEKYSTPFETRQRAKYPQANIVIALIARDVRAIDGQEVEHTPVNPSEEQPGNRAHTDVFGEKTTEARLKFMQIWNPVREITLGG